MYRVLILALLGAVVSCASAGAFGSGEESLGEPVHVPHHLLDGHTELADDGAHHIFVRNRSDATVIITGVRLFDCQNIRTACGSKRVHVAISPGADRRVLVVRPTPGPGPTRFRFEFQYEARR